RAAGVLDLRDGDGTTAPVRVADARRPFLAHHAAAGRVDQVARPPAPRTAELSRAVAGRFARSARPCFVAATRGVRSCTRSVRTWSPHPLSRVLLLPNGEGDRGRGLAKGEGVRR